MTLRKRQRMMVVVLALLLVGGATGLVLAALQDKVAFFVTPSEIASGQIDRGRQFRLGGLVADGSVRQQPDGSVHFAITDDSETVRVSYKGILPDLFRERQGIVAHGRLGEDGTFEAAEVLAKHDENYMPKEVADALKEKGMWQHQQDAQR